MTRRASWMAAVAAAVAIAPCAWGAADEPDASAQQEEARTPGESLLDQAHQRSPQRYMFAVERGATIRMTDDGKSFALLWYPHNVDATSNPPMIVTLHGHGSWAFDEFFLWQPYAAQRGYGILALQWWFGGGEEVEDYYAPQQIYPILEAILRAQGVSAQRVLLHGFSRGAANIYALTALDRASGNRFVAVTVANAGGAAPDYPPNADISRGLFGDEAFEGTRWVMYCGGRDEHPQRDGCPAMRRAAAWIERFGGSLELFIEDPSAGHGGFHRDADHVNAALDLFGRIVKRHVLAGGRAQWTTGTR